MTDKTPKDNLIKFPSTKEVKETFTMRALTPEDLEEIKNDTDLDLNRIVEEIEYVDMAYNKVFEYTKFIEKCSHHMVGSIDARNFRWLEEDLREIFLKLSEKKVDFD